MRIRRVDQQKFRYPTQSIEQPHKIWPLIGKHESKEPFRSFVQSALRAIPYSASHCWFVLHVEEARARYRLHVTIFPSHSWPTQTTSANQPTHRTARIRQELMKEMDLWPIHGLDNQPKSCSMSRTCSAKRKNSSPHPQSAHRVSPVNVNFCLRKGSLPNKLRNYSKRLMCVSYYWFGHSDSFDGAAPTTNSS